jgi:hypothetical protein
MFVYINAMLLDIMAMYAIFRSTFYFFLDRIWAFIFVIFYFNLSVRCISFLVGSISKTGKRLTHQCDYLRQDDLERNLNTCKFINILDAVIRNRLIYCAILFSFSSIFFRKLSILFIDILQDIGKGFKCSAH